MNRIWHKIIRYALSAPIAIMIRAMMAYRWHTSGRQFYYDQYMKMKKDLAREEAYAKVLNK